MEFSSSSVSTLKSLAASSLPHLRLEFTMISNPLYTCDREVNSVRHTRQDIGRLFVSEWALLAGLRIAKRSRKKMKESHLTINNLGSILTATF